MSSHDTQSTRGEMEQILLELLPPQMVGIINPSGIREDRDANKARRDLAIASLQQLQQREIEEAVKKAKVRSRIKEHMKIRAMCYGDARTGFMSLNVKAANKQLGDLQRQNRELFGSQVDKP